MEQASSPNSPVFLNSFNMRSESSAGSSVGTPCQESNYRPGQHNRNLISRMLTESKNTLKHNAIFRELGKKENKQGKGNVQVKVSPTQVDDYNSEGQMRMLELIRTTGMRGGRSMTGVWAPFGEAYKPLGGSPEEPSRVLPMLYREEIYGQKGKERSAASAPGRQRDAGIGTGLSVLSSENSTASSFDSSMPGTLLAASAERAKTAAAATSAAAAHHLHASLGSSLTGASLLESVRASWEKQKHLLDRGPAAGPALPRKSQTDGEASRLSVGREGGLAVNRSSRFLSMSHAAGSFIKPQTAPTMDGGSTSHCSTFRPGQTDDADMEAHPFERDCRLQHRLLQSHPDGYLSTLPTFDKLTSSLGGLLVVDLAAALGNGGSKRHGVEPRAGFSRIEPRASHKVRRVLPIDAEELRVMGRFYSQLCALVEVQRCSDPLSLMVVQKVRTMLEAGAPMRASFVSLAMQEVAGFTRGCGMARHNRYLLSIFTCIARSCNVGDVELDGLVVDHGAQVLLYGQPETPMRLAAAEAAAAKAAHAALHEAAAPTPKKSHRASIAPAVVTVDGGRSRAAGGGAASSGAADETYRFSTPSVSECTEDAVFGAEQPYDQLVTTLLPLQA